MVIDLNLFVKLQQKDDEYLKDNFKRFVRNKYHQEVDFRLKQYKVMLKEIKDLMEILELEQILKEAWSKKRIHDKVYNEYINSDKTIGYVNQRCYFEDRDIEKEDYKALVDKIYEYIVDPEKEINQNRIDKLEKNFYKSYERVEKWINLMN